MECLFGITGKDFVIIAADKVCARSIVVMKSTEDKTRSATPHALMAYCGEPGDTSNFVDFIQRNTQLYGIRNQVQLTTKAVAHFTRKELATSLRSRNAYSVNLLIGGWDAKNGPELYWIDYLSAMTKLPFAAHGYGAYFCLSLMDRFYKPDMSVDEAKKLLQMCLNELKTRFIVNFPQFTVKLIDANGTHDLAM